MISSTSSFCSLQDEIIGDWEPWFKYKHDQTVEKQIDYSRYYLRVTEDSIHYYAYPWTKYHQLSYKIEESSIKFYFKGKLVNDGMKIIILDSLLYVERPKEKKEKYNDRILYYRKCSLDNSMVKELDEYGYSTERLCDTMIFGEYSMPYFFYDELESDTTRFYLERLRVTGENTMIINDSIEVNFTRGWKSFTFKTGPYALKYEIVKFDRLTLNMIQRPLNPASENLPLNGYAVDYFTFSEFWWWY